MLGKLLKYEIKSTARIFLPLYVSLVLLAVISNIFFKINNNELFMNIISVISTSAYVYYYCYFCSHFVSNDSAFL